MAVTYEKAIKSNRKDRTKLQKSSFSDVRENNSKSPLFDKKNLIKLGGLLLMFGGVYVIYKRFVKRKAGLALQTVQPQETYDTQTPDI